MKNFTYRQILLFLLLNSLLALTLAYTSQYLFGLLPCHLCLLQRIPFIAIALLTLLSLLFFSKNQLLQKRVIISCLAFLLGNTILASYHFGVEQHFFPAPKSCSGSFGNENLQQLEQNIAKASIVRCDQPNFTFFKLSMAGWNAIYCLGLALITLSALNKSQDKL